jgi:hypothetical protein
VGTPPAVHRELTTKRLGELAELAFSFKAYNFGFGVSKPYGDSERYDTIIDAREIGKVRVGTPLWRVQVKCTNQLFQGMYHLSAGRRLEGHVVPYKLGEIDFLAAYIIPEETWYIIPIEAFLGLKNLTFRRGDDPRPGMYDNYYEAWQLLRAKLTKCDKCGADTPVRDPICRSRPKS